MTYNETEYIVKNSDGIHYTYWIIHHIPNSTPIYYHGVRSEYKIGVDIRDLSVYHSSSHIVNMLYRLNPEQFEKRIDRIFHSREDANKREYLVHHRLNVRENNRFYNLMNSYEKFSSNNKDHVVCYIGSKTCSIKREQFLLLNKVEIAHGVCKNITTFKTKEGSYIHIDVNKAKEMGLSGVTKGRKNYVNLITNEIRALTKDEYKQYDDKVWKLYGQVFFQYKQKDNPVNAKPIMARKDDPRVINGDLIPFCSGMVTVWDDVTKSYKNVSKEESRNYVSASAKRDNRFFISCYDEKLNVSKIDSRNITDDYKPISCFKLKLVDGGTIQLKDYIEGKHKVKIHQELILNKNTNNIILSNNTDKRLLNFKVYERFSNYKDINYISIKDDQMYFYINEPKEFLYKRINYQYFIDKNEKKYPFKYFFNKDK